uniref:Uncharacterized protein n=1 Tax=Romanomermis culicivorax TaxID=13658 RepID=A0A915IFL6_ROMCU
MADEKQVSLFHTPILFITAYVFVAYNWLKALIFGSTTPHSISISPSNDINGHFESESHSKEELFLLKIQEHNYVEALFIAERNNFSTDDIYKAQFLEEPLSSRIIESCLQNKYKELKLLLKRRSSELLEFWLIILDNIPETTPLESYNFLLPLPQNLSSLWGERIAKELFTLFESRDQDCESGSNF